MRSCRLPTNAVLRITHPCEAALTRTRAGRPARFHQPGAIMFRRKFFAGFALTAFLLITASILLYKAPAAAAFDNAHWGANFFPNTELTTQYGKKVKFYDDL